MLRILRRFLLILITLALGAFGYALLRTETGGGSRAEPGEADEGEAPAPAPEAVEGPAASAQPRRCRALTRGGKRCSREAEAGSDYCWQHGG
jgi:hypothetical protein